MKNEVKNKQLQRDLFQGSGVKLEVSPADGKLKLGSEPTCNSCEHRQRWQYNSKVFQYCGVRKSNRTNNGLLKIKCRDVACLSYKPCTATDTAIFGGS